MPTAAQANQRVLLHPQWQGGHPNALQGIVAPTDSGTCCHHPGPPRAGEPNMGAAEEERSIINIDGGPPNHPSPREAGEPNKGPVEWRGDGRRSTPGQVSPGGDGGEEEDT